MNGTHGTGAGRIHHTVRTAEIQTIGNSAGHNIPQKPGKRVFLPGYIRIGYFPDDFFGFMRIDSRIFKGASPYGMPQPGSKGNHKLLGSGDAEDDAGFAPVECVIRFVEGIFKGFFRHNQAEKLGGVRGFKRRGRDAEFSGIKGKRRDKSAAFAVNMIRFFWICVEEIFPGPVGFRHVGDGIFTIKKETPVCFYPRCFGKETPHADDGHRQLAWYFIFCRFQ